MSAKKYKCPYCQLRLERKELINHIDEEHEDMLPKGYSAARLVYNQINKRTHGTCMICKKETEWDENKQRYDTLCGSKKCHDEYVKMVRTRMVRKYGTETLLNNPEHQKKMLANRSISGYYKFKDGGKIGYVGSYEKKFLEFLDIFMNIKSSDILSPGPTILYQYKGKDHFWVTDFLYEPYNLVFDIKDGGSNPNTRDMKEYREKQKAKEIAIKEQGDYNYIRLTDNKFEQLIEIFLLLKEQDNPTKPLIKINEATILESSHNPFYFYHLVPKGADISKGLFSPMYMAKTGNKKDALKALDKYRERMVNGWGIYKDKDPSDLSLEELLSGLETFRGDGGSKEIYFFKFPPYSSLGKNMKELLKHKDICRIDINNPELQKCIQKIDWGYEGSNSDNKSLNRRWYESVSKENYFSMYDDNSPMLFASINHIGIVTKDGHIPGKFIEKLDEVSALQENKISKSIKLYHGSPVRGLQYIDPNKNTTFSNKAKGKKNLVYASDDMRFAACFGGEWNDGIAKQGTWDHWNTITMGISEEVDLSKPCSIYELYNDGSFERIATKELVSKNKIRVKKEIKYDSFLDMLKDNNIEIISLDEYYKRLNNSANTKYESYNVISEEYRVEDSDIPKNIYHISTVNHDGEIFEPRVYENDNVKKGMERRVKRVCFSDSIEGAYYSIFPNGTYDIDLYVHVPGHDVKIYRTTTDDIYDSDITHEIWVKEPVEMKCIGKVHISGTTQKYKTIDVDSEKSGYGKRKYFKPRYSWVERYDKSTVTEAYVSKKQIEDMDTVIKSLNKNDYNDFSDSKNIVI